MGTSSWETASRTMGGEILKMKKLIPFYSYADQRIAVLTDKKFCSLLRSELVRSKTLFSDAVDWLYRAKLESIHLERQKDDFDILLDEVEVKPNRWDERIPQEFLEKVIDYDVRLIEKASGLEKDLALLIQKLQEYKKAGNKAAGDITISIDVVIEKVDDITAMFKEREAAFDINSLGLRDAFGRMRDRIRRSL